jgi:hypothetical protein
MPEELLIQDGVKYNLWTPGNEPADFEPMIKYHIKDIFGEEARYFPKQKLRTIANNNSIPDGFVIDFKNQRWYVVELKLLCDDAVRRISGQIVDYKNAMKNPHTRQQIFKSIYDELNKAEMHQMLYDLIINRNPNIVVLIDSLEGEPGEQFREKVEGVDQNVKILTFKTYATDGVDPKKVHIHLYTSAFEIDSIKQAKSTEKSSISPMNLIYDGNKIEIRVQPAYVNHKYLGISRQHRWFFPIFGTDFALVTDVGEIKTKMRDSQSRTNPDAGNEIGGIGAWFRAHPELREGDRILIEEIEPKKRYKLEILK